MAGRGIPEIGGTSGWTRGEQPFQAGDDRSFGQTPGSIRRQALPQAPPLLLTGVLEQARPRELARGFRVLRVGGTEMLESAERRDQRRLGVGRTAGFVEHAAQKQP